MNKLSLVIFGIFALFGCKSLLQPHSYTKVDGGLLGRCMVFEKDFSIYRNNIDTPFMGEYIIMPAEKGELRASLSRREKFGQTEAIGQLVKGEKIIIREVRLYESAWTNHYLRIIAVVSEGDYQGMKLDLPTYARYHPWPSVIAPETLNAEAVEFKPEYLRACSGGDDKRR